MILKFTDEEGDPVAVESAAIVGVCIGKRNGPRDASAGDDLVVTLVFTLGTGERPFQVAEPFHEVVAAWEIARTDGGSSGLPGAHGWPIQYPHISSQLPGTPAWKPQAGRPK